MTPAQADQFMAALNRLESEREDIGTARDDVTRVMENIDRELTDMRYALDDLEEREGAVQDQIDILRDLIEEATEEEAPPCAASENS